MLRLVGEISLHRMSLSGTRLSIGKDGTFVTSHDIFDNWLESRVKDFVLCRKRGKDIVKAKGGTRLTRSGSFDDSDGFVIRRRGYHWQSSMLLFLFIQRSQSNNDLNGGRHGAGHCQEVIRIVSLRLRTLYEYTRDYVYYYL